MSESALIIEGPSQADVVKSLTTFMSNKKILHFTLEGGQKFQAYATGMRDANEIDEDTKGQGLVIVLMYFAVTGRGRGNAEAVYFINDVEDVQKWGRWTVLPDT